MPRTGITVVLGLGIICAATGCAQMIETQAIENFTFALQEQDLQSLKESSSPEFEHRALRRADALDDLRILRLPEEPPTIVKVTDTNHREKKVTVQAGDEGPQLLYKLVLNAESGQWVVDDIYMNQKRSKTLNVARSVTEQMDLLLTVRDSLEAWEMGDRSDILATATPRLRKQLASIPPGYLQRISELFAAEKNRQARNQRPEAQLDDDIAIVKIARDKGTLILSYRQTDQQWLLNDAALDTKDEKTSVKSVGKLASVIQAAVGFLAAYEQQDKAALEETSVSKLYRGALLPGDLSIVELPPAVIAPAELDIVTFGDRATFVTDTAGKLVKLDLVLANSEADSETPLSYLVEEVTLYEEGANQRIRLSAMLTSRDRARLFSEALARRDLRLLKSLATPEFNERVWRRVEPQMLPHLPGLSQLQAMPESIDVKFHGAHTEVSGVIQGQPVVYKLRDWNGQLGVDDIELKTTGFPTSLRDRYEMVLPVIEFAIGISRGQIDRIQRNSSDDFNRLVWKQVPSVPDIGFPIAQHLQAPIQSVTQLSPERTEIVLGDDQWGARLAMVRHRGYWTVDEATLIAGASSQQRAEMKQTMRIQLANGLARLREPQRPQEQPRRAAEPHSHFAGYRPQSAQPSTPAQLQLFDESATHPDVTIPAAEDDDVFGDAEAERLMPEIEIPLNLN